MKNLLYLIAATVIMLHVSACSKELVYSCDPETNEWVKENFEAIQQMTRADLLPLSGIKQRGCFRAFTPEQRYNAWIDKLVQVRNLNLRFDQIQHIDALMVKMRVSWFDEKAREDAKLSAEINDFLEQWVNGAYQLGWSKNEIGRIVALLEDVEKEDDTIILRNGTYEYVADFEREGSGGGGGNKPGCNCSLSDDWCFGSYCDRFLCEQTSHGCGTLWMKKCTGRCS
ncbi:MAG: bacteriocin fulvocin C-related protein [Bacteroidales bacterium]|nr:bacteriocin fulvocin C-related protein [Bacteroidales bacterium]